MTEDAIRETEDAFLENVGSVVTFYSYKGGTGRSMALANVACLLGARGTDEGGQAEGGPRPVLTLDWDLEAPGLHRYFRVDPTSDDAPEGVIEYFQRLWDTARREPGWYARVCGTDGWRVLEETCPLDAYVWRDVAAGVDLLCAGRMDGSYADRIARVDWVAFYADYPGVFEAFHELLSIRYRYALLDSRTGLTDAGGICTAVLPEKLVAVFTPNHQSVNGLSDVIRKAVRYRMTSDDMRPLGVFPLPSRVEQSQDELRDHWRRIYQSKLQDLLRETYEDPRLDLTDYLNEVQVPHKSDYAYGEDIATLKSHRDALSLSRAYEAFTRRLEQLDHAGDVARLDVSGTWSAPLDPVAEARSRDWKPITLAASLAFMTIALIAAVVAMDDATKLQESLDAAKGDFAALQDEHKAVLENRGQLEQQVKDLTADLKKAQGTQAEVEERLRGEYDGEIRKLQGQVSAAERAKREAEDRLATERRKREELEKRFDAADAEATRLQEQADLAEQNAERANLARDVALRHGRNALAAAPVSERQREALESGLLAVASSLAAGIEVPPDAYNGLVAAVESRRRFVALPGHTRPIQRLVFSVDGSAVATVDGSGVARLWAVDGGVQVAENVERRLLAVTPFESTVLVAHAVAESVQVKALGDRKTPLELPAPGGVASAAFAPDGETLALGATQGSVTVFDVRSKKRLWKFHPFKQAVTEVAYSPDGSLLLCNAGPGRTRLWRLGGKPGTSDVLSKGFGDADPAQPGLFGDTGWLVRRTSRGFFLAVQVAVFLLQQQPRRARGHRHDRLDHHPHRERRRAQPRPAPGGEKAERDDGQDARAASRGPRDRERAVSGHQPPLMRRAQRRQKGHRPQELHGPHGFVPNHRPHPHQPREHHVARRRVGDQHPDQREDPSHQIGEAEHRRERPPVQKPRGGHLLHHQKRSVQHAADRERDLVAGQRGDRVDRPGQRRGQNGVGRGEKQTGRGQGRVEAHEAPRRDEPRRLGHARRVTMWGGSWTDFRRRGADGERARPGAGSPILHCGRLHGYPVFGQSGRRVPGDRRPAGHGAGQHRARNEPVRDGVRVSGDQLDRRWRCGGGRQGGAAAALVHADGRSAALRSRDSGERTRSAARAAAAGAGPVRVRLGTAAGARRGRPAAHGLSGESARRGSRADWAAGGAGDWERGLRDLFEGGDCGSGPGGGRARPASRLWSAWQGGPARRGDGRRGDCSGRRRRHRLCVEVLCAVGRGGRGSRDRGGPHDPDPLLGAGAGQGGDVGAAAVGARRGADRPAP